MSNIATASPINYIRNGQAIAGTRGFATYLNTAQPRPVTGAGGTANVTLTAGTTNALRGNAELVFAKDAVNRQGQGFSVDFRIDRADQARNLQISFDYRLISGTFSGSVAPATDSDVIVYIYDVTNGVLIEPAGRLLEPMVSGLSYRYTGSFQTSSNSTQYRLIFHVATTSASAYSLGFDNISVSPNQVGVGPVITDWVSYTPTGQFTTNATYTGRWRRVGDSMDLRVKISFSGATNAVTGSFDLPPGYSIDASKMPSFGFLDAVFGDGSLFDQSAGIYYELEVKYNSNTNFIITYQNATTGQQIGISNTTPITIAANDTISLVASVPIAGWSSNVQLSSDTDTRVVSVYRYNNDGVGQVIGTTATKITTLTTGTVDTHAAWDSVNNLYRVPVSGVYRVKSGIRGSGVASGQAVIISVAVDGNQFLDMAEQVNMSSGVQTVNVCGETVLSLRSGQTIEIRARISSGTSTVGSFNVSNLSIDRLSGPSQIASTEQVICFYKNSAGASIPSNTVTAVSHATRVYDSHLAYDGTTFRVPVSGKYEATAAIYFAAVAAAGEIQYVLRKNGVDVAIVANSRTTTSSASWPVNGTIPFDAIAGDQITICAFQSTASPISLLANGNANWFTIKRVGN